MSNTNIKPRTCPFCNRELIFVNENNPNKIQYYIHDDSNNNKCYLTSIGGVIVSKDDIEVWNRRDGNDKKILETNNDIIVSEENIKHLNGESK